MKYMTRLNEKLVELTLFAGVYHAKLEAPGEWYAQFVPHGSVEPEKMEGPFGSYRAALDSLANDDGTRVAEMRDKVQEIERSGWHCYSDFAPEYDASVLVAAEELWKRFCNRPPEPERAGGIGFGNMMAEASPERRERILADIDEQRRVHYEFFVEWTADAREFLAGLGGAQ